MICPHLPSPLWCLLKSSPLRIGFPTPHRPWFSLFVRIFVWYSMPPLFFSPVHLHLPWWIFPPFYILIFFYSFFLCLSSFMIFLTHTLFHRPSLRPTIRNKYNLSFPPHVDCLNLFFLSRVLFAYPASNVVLFAFPWPLVVTSTRFLIFAKPPRGIFLNPPPAFSSGRPARRVPPPTPLCTFSPNP